MSVCVCRQRKRKGKREGERERKESETVSQEKVKVLGESRRDPYQVKQQRVFVESFHLRETSFDLGLDVALLSSCKADTCYAL